MLKITSHQLAQKLLTLPDLLVFVDGIGEDVGISCEPGIGSVNQQDVVVLEITTRKRFEQEEEAYRNYRKMFPEKE